MAFQNKNLSVITYTNGFTLWHYLANDPIATVIGDDYFQDIYPSLIMPGDIIYIQCGDDIYVRVLYIDNGVAKLKKTQ